MNLTNKIPNSFPRSFSYAWMGIKHVFKNERNFRFHTIASVLVIVLALYLKCDLVEMALLVIVITIVLVSEMVNSAIEYTWNKLEPNHHPMVGIIKDVMAGSVLIASVSAVIVGIIIIFRHLI